MLYGLERDNFDSLYHVSLGFCFLSLNHWGFLWSGIGQKGLNLDLEKIHKNQFLLVEQFDKPCLPKAKAFVFALSRTEEHFAA